MNKRLRETPGRKKVTDEELLEAYKDGMFLHQIQKKYICSLRRLHRIVREYEEDNGDQSTMPEMRKDIHDTSGLGHGNLPGMRDNRLDHSHS